MSSIRSLVGSFRDQLCSVSHWIRVYFGRWVRSCVHSFVRCSGPPNYLVDNQIHLRRCTVHRFDSKEMSDRRSKQRQAVFARLPTMAEEMEDCKRCWPSFGATILTKGV